MAESHWKSRWAEILSLIDGKRSEGVLTHGKATLIGHAPDVAPYAYLHTLYEGLSASELEKVRSELGRPLDPCLEWFLQQTNGLNMFVSGLAVYGLRRGMLLNRRDPLWREPYDLLTENEYPPPGADSHHIQVGGLSADTGADWEIAPDGRVLMLDRETREFVREWDSLIDAVADEAQRLEREWVPPDYSAYN